MSTELALGDATLDLSRRIAVTAIVNRTPDSFYDRGALLGADLVYDVCVTLAPRFREGSAGRIDRGATERDRRFTPAHAIEDDEGFLFLRYVG